jgi:branched-subunit amino acid ABC-type transport system permease component
VSGYLQFLLLGLGGGAVLAALGLGLVLTHRASGVVNFAHAAMGMYGAATFFQLRQDGDLVLPIIGLPDRVHPFPAGHRPTFVTALLIALALSGLLGAALHLLVFRHLRRAPALARVVASLGVMLYLLALAGLRFEQGAAVFTIEPILPTRSVEVLGTVVPRDRLILAGIVVAVAAVLGAVYRWTGFGLATRAAAENEKGAVLVGIAPDRLAAVNWALASMLATGAVVLIAPIAGLSPSTTSLLIVPALAAVLLGRLDSFPLTTAAGLAIGMGQSAALHFTTTNDWVPGWVPDGGVQQGLPFVVILATIGLGRVGLPDRATLVEQHLPASPAPRRPAATTLVLGGVALVGLLTLGSSWRLGIVTSLTGTLLALSIVVLTGYVGQISLAPLALAGLAGFSMARLAEEGWPTAVALLAGVGLAVVVGLLAALPATRVRGMTLAVATLAAAVGIEELVLRSSAFTGDGGAARVRPLSIGGLDLDIAARGDAFPRPAFGIAVLVLTALAALAVANLRRSPTGLRWLAVRSNERAAAAVGVDVVRAKLGAFTAAAVLAGLGGTLLALQRQQLSAESFVVLGSLSLVALTYLGGIAGITGAVVAGLLTSGGLVTVLTNQGTASGSQLQFAISGLALVVATVALPDGLAAPLHRLRARLPIP